MKKLLFSVLVLVVAYTTQGQVKIGNNPTTIGASSLLELESSNKALVITRVANTAAILTPVNGMIIHDLSSNCLKVYQNNAWSNCINTTAATATFVATCTGFLGSYCAGVLSGTTYEVTITNNDFSAKQVTPQTADLTLTGISGVTVSAVSPSVATTVNAGASLVITYTIAGTPAAQGTLTGTFAKQGLTCSSTVAVGQSQTVTASSSSPIVGINNAIPTVTHTTTSATGIGAATGLPTGVTAVWASNTITISGTPSVAGAFNYSIPLTGGCGSAANATGTITVVNCGAFVAAGVFKEFACFNLGATNTSLDPNVPVQAIHGNYYQWGRIGAVANASTPAGTIAGWNTTEAANGSWLDASKTVNDPCPAGFRVPTKTQWDGVNNASFNTVSRTGTWATNATNFGSAIHYGPSVSVKTLTLPAAGSRSGAGDGILGFRGREGYYWSTTELVTTQAFLLVFGGSFATTTQTERVNGFSVRCVSE